VNDVDEPDETRGLVMFERDERAANLEASDVGPVKLRTRPDRSCWWSLVALLAPCSRLF
jgi:hypothetical protein